VITWNERKRDSNIKKHGFDFADAYLVYDDPEKLTTKTFRNDEERALDVAMVEVRGIILALVYVERGVDVRVISFRPASRRERKRYERAKAEQD
jgi:uncharacterized DUF497 family protein